MGRRVSYPDFAFEKQERFLTLRSLLPFEVGVSEQDGEGEPVLVSLHSVPGEQPRSSLNPNPDFSHHLSTSVCGVAHKWPRGSVSVKNLHTRVRVRRRRVGAWAGLAFLRPRGKHGAGSLQPEAFPVAY